MPYSLRSSCRFRPRLSPFFPALILLLATSSPAIAQDSCYEPIGGDGCDMFAVYIPWEDKTYWNSYCTDGSYYEGTMAGNETAYICALVEAPAP